MGDLDTSKNLFRGIAVPHPKVIDSTALWPEQSSYDQAGPTAGVPEDQDGSAMVLEAFGDQTASTTLRVRTKRGGFPGNGASYIHRAADSGDWYGWNTPATIWGYERVGAAGLTVNPSALTLANGNVLVFVSSSLGGSGEVRVWEYVASTNAWSVGATVVANEGAYSNLARAYCDAVQLPSGRILCFYLVEDSDNATVYTINVRFSDDNGDTWAEWATYACSDPTRLDTDTNVPFRLRAAYSEATGEILLILWVQPQSGTYTQCLLQYASNDLGASFSYVGGIDGTDADDQSVTGDVVVADGVFVVLSDNPSSNGSVNGSEVFRLGSAFEAIGAGGSGDPFAVSNRNVLSGSTVQTEQMAAACVSPDGVIWYFSTNLSATVDNFLIMYSEDGGLSWKTPAAGTLSTGYGSTFQPGVITVQITKPALAWQRGRIILVCNHDSPTTTSDDDDLTALYLGGFSTVTLPYRAVSLAGDRIGRTPDFQTGWERNWLPFELPGNDGWTKSTSGTQSEAISSGALRLTATSGIVRYTVTPTADGTLTAYMDVAVNSGSAEVFRWRYDDGSSVLYTVGIQLTTTAISIIDDPTGAATSLDSDTHGGGRVQFIVSIDGSSVRVWWRDQDTSELQAWTLMSGTASNLGTSALSDQVRFGIASTTTANLDVYQVAYSEGAETGAGLGGFTNPDDLQGRNYAPGGYSTYVDAGVSIYGVDGPTGANEDWHIDTRYEHPVERAFVGTSPSPRIGWRSSTAAASMALAWRRSTSGFESRAYNGAEVLHFEGINWRQAQLQRTRNNGSSWTDEVEIINYKAITFSRIGDVVYPGSGTAADAIYLHENELAGGTFEDGAGKVRKIAGNTAGAWVIGTTNSHKAAIFLESADDTEATSGTGEIWFPRLTVIFSPYTCDGLRIQLHDDGAGHDPADGYYTIGSMFHGRLVPFGRDYSFGRVVTTAANTEISETRAGHRRSRVNGPTRRSVSVAFPAIDVTQYSEEGQPDSIEYNATFVNTRTAPDEPVKIPGLLEYLRGSHRLCLYLPKIDRFSGADGNVQYNLHGAEGAILGRLVGPVSLTAIAGDESTSEVLSIAQITIEEEV